MNKPTLKFSVSGHDYTQPLALLWFSADWCEPCKKMAPVMDALVGQAIDQIRVLKIDIDQQVELAASFQIEAVPSLVLLKTDGEISRRVGEPNTQQLKAWLTPVLEQIKETGETKNEQ